MTSTATTESILKMPTRRGATELKKQMANKAKNDKGSILVDIEAMLDVFEPCFMRMPKVRRLHGAAVRMEDAAYDMIHFFSIAYELSSSELDVKYYYIRQMLGAFARMQSCFKRLMKVNIDTQKTSAACTAGQVGLFSDSAKLAIARHMEKIEEGINKWRNSVRSQCIMSDERSAGMARISPAVFRE